MKTKTSKNKKMPESIKLVEKKLRSLVLKNALSIKAYYNDANKDYWVPENDGSYMKINSDSLKFRFMERGLWGSRTGGVVSEADSAVLKIQQERRVHYAAPLAGYDAGRYEIEGKQILVTNSPKIIETQQGDWSVLHTFLGNLFGDQYAYVLGWLKIAYEELLDRTKRKRRPGQVLAIAGEKDCGKSLFQRLVTKILGGRSAKPYQFMSGDTGFNKELFEAEHLVLDDESAKTQIQKRRNLGAFVKVFAANEEHRCHEKHKTPLTLTPFWRMTISVNEEPENLLVLPPIDESLTDKIILLKAYKHPMPMPTVSSEDREAFWSQLVKELSAFLYWLVDWEIPEDLKSHRYGITHFHHPEILEALEELQPEYRLLELIDAHYFSESDSFYGAKKETKEITKKAEQIEESLMLYHPIPARSILNFYRACGTYLSRLARKFPHRVQKGKARGEWILYPPAKSE